MHGIPHLWPVKMFNANAILEHGHQWSRQAIYPQDRGTRPPNTLFVAVGLWSLWATCRVAQAAVGNCEAVIHGRGKSTALAELLPE
jgi:hypothetical protein